MDTPTKFLLPFFMSFTCPGTNIKKSRKTLILRDLSLLFRHLSLTFRGETGF